MRVRIGPDRVVAGFGLRVVRAYLEGRLNPFIGEGAFSRRPAKVGVQLVFTKEPAFGRLRLLCRSESCEIFEVVRTSRGRYEDFL